MKSKTKPVKTVLERMRKTVFPRICCSKHKKADKREPGLLRQELRCSEMLCLCAILNVKGVYLAVKD